MAVGLFQTTPNNQNNYPGSWQQQPKGAPRHHIWGTTLKERLSPSARTGGLSAADRTRLWPRHRLLPRHRLSRRLKPRVDPRSHVLFSPPQTTTSAATEPQALTAARESPVTEARAPYPGCFRSTDMRTILYRTCHKKEYHN